MGSCKSRSANTPSSSDSRRLKRLLLHWLRIKVGDEINPAIKAPKPNAISSITAKEPWKLQMASDTVTGVIFWSANSVTPIAMAIAKINLSCTVNPLQQIFVN